MRFANTVITEIVSVALLLFQAVRAGADFHDLRIIKNINDLPCDACVDRRPNESRDVLSASLYIDVKIPFRTVTVDQRFSTP